MSLVKLLTLLMAAAAVSQIFHETLSRHPILAQSLRENPETFTIPDSLPDDTTLKVDGSTSMRVTNQELESRFETQFPNADVELNASRTTDTVIEALGNDGIGYGMVSQVIDREGVSTDAAASTNNPAPGSASIANEPTAFVPNMTATSGRGGFPFWLLPLLAIPLLGALLWWLLKNNGVTAPVGVVGAVTAPATPRMILTPRDSQNAYAYWEIPQERLAETKRQGGETMMIRIYDVTGRSTHAPLPAPIAEFPCIESNPDLHLPIVADDRSYCGEVGYLTADNQWVPIVKSNAVRIPVGPEVAPKLAGTAAVAANFGATARPPAAAAILQTRQSAVILAEPETTGPSQGGVVQTVKVHSRNNAVMFNKEQLHHIEHAVANTHRLEPGMYTLRLRDGVFNYDADDNHPGEPFVLLWIHGGTVVNQKTGVPVSSTWTTLNGYADTLSLDVREPATLCAFFMDTYPDDNSGEVILSVAKH